MSLAKRFEELEIWQRARAQVPTVYRRLAECRHYGFKDQVQRAVISVMTNIAEGFERRSQKEFAHYLDVAKASTSNGEVRSMLYAAEDLEYLDAKQASEMRETSESLSASIAALSRSFRK